MKKQIYADNAATARLSPAALEAMMPWLTREYGNASQPHSPGLRAREAIEEARKTVAECIGVSPEGIFFTSGGTESDNWAIRRFSCDRGGKRRVITSPAEHHAVLNSCREAESSGAEITFIPVGKGGEVSAYDLAGALGEGGGIPTLVSLMLVNNETGALCGIRELADAAHRKGAYFHTDAVQAVGRIPVDAEKLCVDMLSASAHKFGGPDGVGFLFVKEGTPLSPLMAGGAQERSMRAGTENVAGIVGMAAALRFCTENLDLTRKRLLRVEKRLIAALDGADFLINGSDRAPGILSLSFRGADGETILHRLDLKGIAVSTGAACDSVRTRTSHVIDALGVPHEYANGTVRISFGADNTEEEAEIIASEILKILSKGRD